jgi:hypothetical protein
MSKSPETNNTIPLSSILVFKRLEIRPNKKAQASYQCLAFDPRTNVTNSLLAFDPRTNVTNSLHTENEKQNSLPSIALTDSQSSQSLRKTIIWMKMKIVVVTSALILIIVIMNQKCLKLVIV